MRQQARHKRRVLRRSPFPPVITAEARWATRLAMTDVWFPLLCALRITFHVSRVILLSELHQEVIPMLHDQTFAFIGSGAMGEAMIKGLISQANLPPQQITASDPREERGQELQTKYGVRPTTDNLVAIDGAKIVVLSVKPQVLHGVMTQLAGHIAPEA